jgi:beta-phosphoglucomutase-like phosphatase (HAD superfamily)
VGGDQVEHGKPEPDVYREAARQMGVNPQACLTIEDSVHGMRSAKGAGTWCLVIPGKNQLHQDFSEADLMVPNLWEFIKLIKTG